MITPPLPRMSARFHRPMRAIALLGVSLLALDASGAWAQGPRGGVVVRGNARISQTATQSTITQRSQRAVIDWRDFDVSKDHSVVFDQPGRSSATLNRVNSVRGSVIQGTIRAPGTVIIQNTAGVIFTGTAKVDTGGLVATSQTVNAARLMREGGLDITGGELAGARVVNQGEITIKGAGLGALVGSSLENAGAIVADKGIVALASGARTTIDLGGDGMLRIAVTGNTAQGSGITNTGTIDVGEGRVLLSAGDASRTLDAAINTTGVIRAVSGTGTGGQIELIGRGTGKVRVAGRVTATGPGKGGAITATGADLTLASGARLDASGGDQGGSVRLGGDAQGKGKLRRADTLRIDQRASIAANGDSAGKIIAWSETATSIDGALTATGAVAGGFVETSSRGALGVGEHASVTVGEGGSWLLDPRDILLTTGGLARDPMGTVIPPSGSTPYAVDRFAVITSLNGGSNVTITTAQPASSMAGDITVDGDLVWSGAGDLHLNAERDITLNAAVQSTGAGDFSAQAARDIRANGIIQSNGTGNVALDAGRDIHLDNTLRIGGTGALGLTARQGDIVATDRSDSNVAISTASGDMTMTATQGSILLRRSGGVFNNLRVYSDQGNTSLTAGTRILAQGSNGGGSWVRIGSATSAGRVALTAPNIAIQGGTGGNSFAEVTAGAGGSVSLIASQSITTQDNAISGSQGRIAAVNGATLEMRAPRQIWNGPVRSGTGVSDGGTTRLSGAITASVVPVFSLAPDENFVLYNSAPGGSASSYASPLGLYVQTTGNGAIKFEAPVNAARVELISEQRVFLTTRGRLTGTGPGDAVVVAAGRTFQNDAGADALTVTDPTARWLLYIDTFAGLKGAEPRHATYDLYGRPFPTTPPAVLGDFPGNRVVYGETPVLTVTAGSGTRTYGGALADLGYELQGLRPRDSAETALTGTPSTDSLGNRATASAGSYATTALATASAQGYAIAYVDGTLTVDPAALTVTANGSRGYGAPTATYTVTYDGFVLGEDKSALGGALVFTTPATQSSDVGTYSLTASGLDSANYAITYTDGTLRITPAALTVTANDATRTYGAANPTLGATLTGLVLGQTAADLDGALKVTTTATRASDTGTYATTASGLDSRNYAITYTDGTLRITPAALTITANDATRTYGAANPTLGATLTGLVLGQTAADLDGALKVTTTATRASDTGTYATTASGLDSRNYAITYTDGTLSIDPAALTVTANDATRGYGKANPEFGATFDGFVLNQTASDIDGTLKFTTDATKTSPVGTYDLTPGGLSSGNYAITFVGGTLTVAPATVIPDPVIPDPVRPTNVAALTRPFERGVPPYTPGDASFRTTKAEAPPAIDNPFDLTYSLGDIVSLSPQGAADSAGFVPAAGGEQAPADAANASCGGAVNRGDMAVCARQITPESYWSTSARESN